MTEKEQTLHTFRGRPEALAKQSFIERLFLNIRKYISIQENRIFALTWWVELRCCGRFKECHWTSGAEGGWRGCRASPGGVRLPTQ